MGFAGGLRRGSGGVLGLEQGFEGVEFLAPEALVMADPLRAGMQRARVQPAGVHATLHLALDQPCAFEYLDVLGRARQRDVEGRGEFADGTRLRCEIAQHRAPRGIREGMKNVVESGRGFINHKVEYTPPQRIVNLLVEYISRALHAPTELARRWPDTQGPSQRRWWQNADMRRHAVLLLCSLAMLMADAPCAAAAERVLVFSRTAGYRHDSIPTAVATLRRLSAEAGLVADHSEDADDINTANLAHYRVVVFASTTGDVLDPAQQQALEEFVRRGGGFVGVHSASDTEYDWPWYGRLVGAYFLSHPPGLQSTHVQPERDGKPKGVAWPVRDELYNYRSNPRGHVQVVATIEERRYEGGTMGADHPITWCHAVDGGRSWYTGLGHDAALYEDPNFLTQLKRGLRYAAGRSEEC